jgi:hypothetical protein
MAVVSSLDREDANPGVDQIVYLTRQFSSHYHIYAHANPLAFVSDTRLGTLAHHQSSQSHLGIGIGITSLLSSAARLPLSSKAKPELVGWL